MNLRWLKKRLPQASQCRERLGMHRWQTGETSSDAKRPVWIARALRGLMLRFDDPRVWHLNRRSVSGAVAIGLFIAWLPIPTQMIVAACCAAMLRVHVPLSVVMVWFTNPLTVAPLGYAAWRIGSTLLDSPPPTDTPYAMGLTDIFQRFGSAWPEILVGCVFAGACCAVAGYALTLAVWRISTIRRWRGRRRTARANPLTS